MNKKSTSKPIYDLQTIRQKNLDLNDLPTIDSFRLSKDAFRTGFIKAVLFTLVSIFVFFTPMTVGGKTDIVYGIMYNSLMRLFGNFGLWIVTLIIMGNGIFSVIGKYMVKSGKLYDYYEGDSIVHPILYLIGGAYVFMYSTYATLGWKMPEIIVGQETGGGVIPSTVVAVFWIILVGCFTMPFLLNYGVVDFIGSFMEPLMRPIWKVPGRAAVNAIASFVSSSSVGVLITNKLYRMKVYTEKEAILVVTGFSAVSVGFAYMVIQTAGLDQYFLKIYFSSLLLTLVVSAFIARIPPLSKKSDMYLDGKVQTQQDRQATRYDEGLWKVAIDRAAKKGYTAPPLHQEIFHSLIDGIGVLPKVISLLACVGVSALILAENTPVFQIMGKLFEPLLVLLRVPNADIIAPSFPVGIAEMFLPVLLIKNYVDVLALEARYIVVVVSIVQILFFSETIVVITASKLPIKLHEIIMVFFERTFIAIPFAVLFARILF